MLPFTSLEFRPGIVPVWVSLFVYDNTKTFSCILYNYLTLLCILLYIMYVCIPFIYSFYKTFFATGPPETPTWTLRPTTHGIHGVRIVVLRRTGRDPTTDHDHNKSRTQMENRYPAAGASMRSILYRRRMSRLSFIICLW